MLFSMESTVPQQGSGYKQTPLNIAPEGHRYISFGQTHEGKNGQASPYRTDRFGSGSIREILSASVRFPTGRTGAPWNLPIGRHRQPRAAQGRGRRETGRLSLRGLGGRSGSGREKSASGGRDLSLWPDDFAQFLLRMQISGSGRNHFRHYP